MIWILFNFKSTCKDGILCQCFQLVFKLDMVTGMVAPKFLMFQTAPVAHVGMPCYGGMHCFSSPCFGKMLSLINDFSLSASLNYCLCQSLKTNKLNNCGLSKFNKGSSLTYLNWSLDDFPQQMFSPLLRISVARIKNLVSVGPIYWWWWLMSPQRHQEDLVLYILGTHWWNCIYTTTLIYTAA